MPGERNGLLGLLPSTGNLRDWRQVLDVVSNNVVPGDWYNSQTRTWNNPMQAFGLDRLVAYFRDSGQPIPAWLRLGVDIPGADPYSGPGTPGYKPSIPGNDSPFNGQGPLMGYQKPPQRRPGRSGHGRTIAEGEAAQSMFDGMREGARQGVLDDAQRQWQERASGIQQ